MRYEVVKIRITPKNIDKFLLQNETRMEHPDFIKDREFLENEMVLFQKGQNTQPYYADRFDLTVFTYNQFDKEWLIVDGSHRIEGLRRLFKKGFTGFDAILIPSNILGANSPAERVALSRELDKLLIKEGLPLWIKKYDFAFEQYEPLASFLGILTEVKTEFVSWSNKNLIDSGGRNKIKLTLDEYDELRKPQQT